MTDWNSAPEDRGRYVGPVEPASVEELFPHGCVERGDAQRLFEQVTVDVGELGQVLVERRSAVIFRVLRT